MASENLQGLRPTFWKVAPGVVWIQVHQPYQARALARIRGGRRVAYSIAGTYLRTFEFQRSLGWAQRWVTRQLARRTGTNEGFSLPVGPERSRLQHRMAGPPGGLARRQRAKTAAKPATPVEL